tara:strand:- start:3861 stop:4799 length:939 start_codon:yes stop_codon:yes gene_type:complete
MPEAQPSLSEEKTIPIEDTGNPVDVEVKEEQTEENQSTPVETQEETPESSEHEEYSSGVKKRINDLTKKWREEERQKKAALEFAESAKKKNDELQKKFTSLDDTYIEEVAQRVDATEMALKRALSEAHQKQDFDAVAEAQAKLAENAVHKQRVVAAKNKKDVAPKEEIVSQGAPQQVQQQVQQQQAPQPSQKALQWAQRNQWFGQGEGKDQAMTYATWGIHTTLVNEGMDPESDDYYNEIDTRLKGYFPDKIGQTNSNTSIASNKVAQTVAGANTRVGNKTGRRTVKLTPSQVAIAKKLGVPLDEYAKFVKE